MNLWLFCFQSSPSILVQEATAWCAAFGPISRDREMRKGFDDTLWMRTRQVLRKLRRIFVWRCEDWPLPCTAPVLFSKQVVATEIFWFIDLKFCFPLPPFGTTTSTASAHQFELDIFLIVWMSKRKRKVSQFIPNPNWWHKNCTLVSMSYCD